MRGPVVPQALPQRGACFIVETCIESEGMHLSKFRSGDVARVLLAIVLLSAIACVAGRHLAPGVPLYMLLLYCAMGAAVFLVLLALLLVASLTWRQAILREGGTDAQWLWFPDEPEGLRKLRAEAAEDAQKPGP